MLPANVSGVAVMRLPALRQ